MKKQLSNTYAMVLMMGIIIMFTLGVMKASAQQPAASNPNSELIDPGVDVNSSEYVTINVKNANISEVLKAYSLQTGQSIVVGPDVVSDNVNVRLNNIPWQDALDVILKPYGFGYRVVGDTIVISKLENIVTVEGIEPLVSKVFTLQYVDAYDIKEVCEAQLSSRGKLSIMKNKGLPGWEFGGGSAQGSGANSSQTGLGVVKREERSSIEKSKKLIITDVPSNVSQIEKVIDALDLAPSQVLIEARFIEISTDDLKDMGLDFATGVNGLNTAGVQVSNDGNNRWGVEKNDSLALSPPAFDPASESLSSSLPYNSGLQLLFSRIGGENFEVMLHALEESGVANVLSAPRVLTQNNQEAAILVGEKFPIIESQSNSGGSGNNVTSTTLKYYENIGIQLNVIPQVCADGHINMIVHPVVSSIDGFEQGVVSTGADSGALTRYPRLKVREAQTQILLKSKDTVAIGGLQNEVSRSSEYKVPVLGNLPFLGRLFRRETHTTKKIDLLILIKATTVDRVAYAQESIDAQQAKELSMGMAEEMPLTEMTEADAVVVKAKPVEEVVVTEASDEPAAMQDNSSVENDEILAMVRSMDAPTNTVDSE